MVAALARGVRPVLDEVVAPGSSSTPSDGATRSTTDHASPAPDEARTVPSLYIDGAWTASADGACSPVVNPSDATVVTEVDVATDAQVEAAIAAARRAFDATDWPRTPDRRARGAARPRRRPDRPRPRGDGPPRDAQHRQGDAREPLGHGRRRARLPLLRRPRRQGGRPPRRRGQPGRAQPDRLRAGRRVRAHRAVELPAPPDELEDRAGARGRQHARS